MEGKYSSVSTRPMSCLTSRAFLFLSFYHFLFEAKKGVVQMRDEKEILAAIEAGFQKQFELQKYIARQLVKVVELQEKQLDMFEQAEEVLRNA